MKNIKRNWSLVPNDTYTVGNNVTPHEDGGYIWEEIATLANKDDARLISAAPELLNAAKYLVSFLAHEREYSGEDLDRMKMAIAKAEGKE